ncbi:MAG TPA: histidine phosphatase family protein [Povalibacter sp.]|uniref:SixA phosphatase family protein n=1 Tax=Povalibacter sp. TaxID=1962978 RepID=UPI002C0D43C8|nr:histidine phosphatase family protein [Povalibacter sp.]HMN43376.1 histidine phosphatase family protein [Povalibacter sp.]
MLRLTLVRHAKTEPAAPGQEDWDRALETRGQRDAPEMARRLKDEHGKPDRILTSPAIRAITTANLMSRVLGVPAAKIVQDERLYLASPKTMLEVVNELGNSAKHLMVVGHNPGITEFADQLSGERSIDNMPTCAVYTLQFDIAHWNELVWATGVDADFDYPKKA